MVFCSSPPEMQHLIGTHAIKWDSYNGYICTISAAKETCYKGHLLGTMEECRCRTWLMRLYSGSTFILSTANMLHSERLDATRESSHTLARGPGEDGGWWSCFCSWSPNGKPSLPNRDEGRQDLPSPQGK